MSASTPKSGNYFKVVKESGCSQQRTLNREIYVYGKSVVICAKISSEQPGTLPKTRDGNLMKLRFRQALLGTE